MKTARTRIRPRALAAAATVVAVAAGGAEIERVEPPFWWVGFRHAELQLMVYGEDVGALAARVDAPGVVLRGQTTAESPNYLFLNLAIEDDAEPGAFDIRFVDGAGAEALRHRYRLEARSADPDWARGFTSADAVYLVTPDRFANGDPANDEIPGLGDALDRSMPLARHGGDLRGIAERLDYIAELGFTALWINPVLENAMPEHSYHGYSITDFYRVDPRFGSNEELAALAPGPGERGVGLIVDMVVNHGGSHHWWMNDLPSADWINQWDGYVETNHRKTLSLDPYAAEADREEFFAGWFVPTMPDLNPRNPQMANYLIQNAIWWIEYLGLKGARMDTYPYAGPDFMAEWTRRVMREYPDFTVVGEEWTLNPLVAAYWQRGRVNHDGYRSWLGSVMDFPTQSRIVPALTQEESFFHGLITLYDSLVNDVLYPDPHAR